MKSGLWREEIRKGAAIKAAILKEFVAADNVVVMQTLKAMQGERGLIDDIPRAIKTAARLIIARDKQNPQRQEAA
jgi:hypothetical protein